MKKYIILAFVFSFFNTKAQITLIHTYDSASTIPNGSPALQDQLMLIKFETSGEKYVKINRHGKKILIYDLNHSLLKTIDFSGFPQSTLGGNFNFILYLSEKLFNTDVQIEFMYLSQNGGVSFTGIYNEEGSLLFSDTGAAAIIPNFIQQQYPIYNTTQGTIMILSYRNGQTKVFSLPGTLSASIEQANMQLMQQSGQFGNLYPNPGPGAANNTTGTYNTFVGYGAIANGNYTNATAVGNGAIVTASNMVRVGNTTVSVIQGQVAWSTSDGRFKYNIQENVKGLDFINILRPVTYQMNTKQLDDFIIQNMPDSIKTMHQEGIDFAPSMAKIHAGFIAQEVDSAAQACGFISSIVHTPANSTDPYALSYEELVVPLVKAVQELSIKVDSLLAITNPAGTRMMNNNSGGQGRGYTEANTLQVELTNNNYAILYQNEPNPFGYNTVIRYFIPENNKGNAFIVFYDMYGKEIKKAELTTKGFGNIYANTENLASGIYSYSLIINDNVVDTKKMIRNK